MGPLLVGAAGLMGGTWLLRALVPAAASALCACRLGGLRSAAGSCGALRLLPEGTLGSCGSWGAVAPAALGDFGVDWGCLHNSRYYVAEF